MPKFNAGRLSPTNLNAAIADLDHFAGAGKMMAGWFA